MCLVEVYGWDLQLPGISVLMLDGFTIQILPIMGSTCRVEISPDRIRNNMLIE